MGDHKNFCNVLRQCHGVSIAELSLEGISINVAATMVLYSFLVRLGLEHFWGIRVVFACVIWFQYYCQETYMSAPGSRNWRDGPFVT